MTNQHTWKEFWSACCKLQKLGMNMLGIACVYQQELPRPRCAMRTSTLTLNLTYNGFLISLIITCG